MAKKIWVYLSKYKLNLFLTLVFALIGSVLALLTPKYIGNAIDAIIGIKEVDTTSLKKYLLILLLLYFISFIMNRYAQLLANKVANYTARDIRKAVFTKLHSLPINYYDTHKHGNIISMLTIDIDNVTEGLLGLLTQMLTGIITIVGALVLMAILSPYVALAVLLITPLSVLIAKFIMGRSAKMFRAQQELIGRLNSFSEETISGLDVIKSYVIEDLYTDGFKDINSKLYTVGQMAQFYSSLVNPAARFVNHISYILVGIAGGYLAISNILSVGQIAAMLSYATQFAKPINEITSVTTQMQNAIASANRIFSLLETESESKDVDNILKLNSSDVCFEDISFSYNKEKPLIKNLHLKVETNNIIAIVGSTGAGKSTLINLLMRFYDADSGKITIDGTDINSVTRDSLRTTFAMVLQDTWIFTGTVRDNIAFGKPDATVEEIKDAASKSHIDRFIETLPKSYDTIIKQDDLSSGQLQLLTIARAMLMKPTMLILDEATSNVDTRTEQYIVRAFKHMMQGRTSFVIAHRLSTIRDADVILVMKDGDIVEKGNHDTLINAKGTYYNLYKKSLNN